MIQITPQMRVLVAVEAVDFRRGIDGLAQLCRVVLQADPFTGAVFVFRSRRRTAIKLLVYDGQGFWLCQREACPRGTSGSRRERSAGGRPHGRAPRHFRRTNCRC